MWQAMECVHTQSLIIVVIKRQGFLPVICQHDVITLMSLIRCAVAVAAAFAKDEHRNGNSGCSTVVGSIIPLPRLSGTKSILKRLQLGARCQVLMQSTHAKG